MVAPVPSVVDPVPLIVVLPFHVSAVPVFVVTVTAAEPVSVPAVRFKIGMLTAFSKSATPPLMAMVKLPVLVIVLVTVVVPAVNASVPAALVILVMVVPMAPARAVTPPSNWSVPAAGTKNVPALSLPPPCRERVPVLTLTVPVLLNSVATWIVLPATTALVKVPALAKVPVVPEVEMLSALLMVKVDPTWLLKTAPSAR